MIEYNLTRFIEKQKSIFDVALSEIKSGKKRSHWMWYIFPQLRALCVSETSVYYGIAGLAEAKAYMNEPYLRENLITITKALLHLKKVEPYRIMGDIDHLKLCSCMTLFEIAAPDVTEFSLVLEKFYDGKRDIQTLENLKFK